LQLITGKATVSARDLHEVLGITERFASWFERMKQYGFEESVDYTNAKSFTEVKTMVGYRLESILTTNSQST
jgi:phage anti-repressor protein